MESSIKMRKQKLRQANLKFLRKVFAICYHIKENNHTLFSVYQINKKKMSNLLKIHLLQSLSK